MIKKFNQQPLRFKLNVYGSIAGILVYLGVLAWYSWLWVLAAILVLGLIAGVAVFAGSGAGRKSIRKATTAMSTNNTPQPGYTPLPGKNQMMYTAQITTWAGLANLLNKVDPYQLSPIEQTILELWQHGLVAAIGSTVAHSWLDEQSLANAQVDIQQAMEVQG